MPSIGRGVYPLVLRASIHVPHALKKATREQLSRMLSIPKTRALEVTIEAWLVAAVVKEAGPGDITHAELARQSGPPRSAGTGIPACSLQRVTIDRLLSSIGNVPPVEFEEKYSAVKKIPAKEAGLNRTSLPVTRDVSG